jgi:hypothetical protein
MCRKIRHTTTIYEQLWQRYGVENGSYDYLREF